MSTTSSSATTTLYVNGKPAQDELARLRAEVDKYKKQLLDIASDPSKGLGSSEWGNTLKKLKGAEKGLDKVQSQVASVSQALAHLDKATPEELRKALRQLNKELASIERGSKAWDEQVKKIRAVKEELAKVNAETKAHTSLWDRFAKKMFDWGAAIQTVMSAATGITLTARKAVEAYAEMDQEMANVRKFTGMTVEQVEDLNEEFKKMDTRTSRVQLNKLAQEAGRLGMQSQEDVLGFVRAADQINVALDDLGDGATLTLSKLTDIFGDKERLGVEQSLLSVGSVINELSQNCTASAPYLAEFASRMGGVGAQAGMNIPQIMAFGAVLDSNNQKVEASSTALSQVITRLYQDPAKYARVAGLDIQKFSELVRTDANEALLTLLQTLNQAGGLERLAPMFKDMGENGARAISALSTLAGHIDEVRRQQQVANQAFREATSVTNEFNVQNNTVQAGLDKAKKAFNEMAVNLGKQLLPVMRFAITSSSALMKVLSLVINFMVKYKAVIVSLTAGVVGYYVAVNAATIATKIATAAKAAWAVVAGTCSVVGKGLSAVMWLLLGNVTKAKNAWIAMSAVMKANPIGMLVAAITALGTALYFLTKRTSAQAEAQKSLNNIKSEAAQKLADEKQKIDTLMQAASNLNLTYEEQKKAVDQLNGIIPGFNGRVDATTRAFRYSEKALSDYCDQLLRLYELEGAKEKLKELGQQRAELVLERAETEKALNSEKERQQKQNAAMAGNRNYTTTSGANAPAVVNISLSNTGTTVGLERKLSNIDSALNVIDAKKAAINNLYGNDLEKQAANGTPETPVSDITYAGGGGSADDKNGGGSSKTEDKSKTEKAWREQQIALAKIAYFKGETDYEQHQQRLEQIDMDFANKLLERTDLTESERLDAQAKYWEAKNKLDKRAHTKTITEENEAYADLRRQVQEDYLQNRISKESYDIEMENIEFAHLLAMTQLTKEGTEERRRAEETYRQRLVAEQQKRQKQYADNEKAHQERLKQMWDKYFVTDDETKQLQYDTALTLLDEVYKSELAKCADNNEKKLELDKRYAKARKKLYDEIFNGEKNGQKSWEKWIGGALDKIFGQGTWDKYGEVIKNAYASMTSMMQGFNQLAQAEAEIKVARLERQYDLEISMAEGNNRKVRALERKKEKETARIKAEAQRKEFAQQVMNAIASTALAAINAYASAAKIAWWLGPVAAGMALAAGAVQIAAIKKQQEASDAKGFAEGGFTPAGPKDKPVGVVHAGEWVASQKLLADPVARPMIDALDYAQRNNTLGSLRPADVSRAVTAPAVIAGAAADGHTEQLMVAVAAALGNYGGTMARLTERLNEPFVTVNTVTGDMGIKEAQDEYQRLMNNTLPKSKRK